jgi:shikimate kinase
MTDTFRTSRTVSALDPGKPHLILVGLPGSGKTTIGAMLAERLGRTFLDFDAEIERREGMPVASIFAQRGEQAFRVLERKLTEELRDVGNMVVAPGGGWAADPSVVARRSSFICGYGLKRHSAGWARPWRAGPC